VDNKTPENFTCCRCGKLKPWIVAWSFAHTALSCSTDWSEIDVWCDDCEDKEVEPDAKAIHRNDDNTPT